jgi:PKD repeat protein
MTPLLDGARQFVSLITQPGTYTDTITVFNEQGNQTGTVTKSFTVTPPPGNGPSSDPPCSAPE